MQHWLFKTEPETYSIADLQREGRCGWEGIRNYQARNRLRDEVARLGMAETAQLLQGTGVDEDAELHPEDNPFSGNSYRMINFIVDFPVRVGQ